MLHLISKLWEMTTISYAFGQIPLVAIVLLHVNLINKILFKVISKYKPCRRQIAIVQRTGVLTLRLLLRLVDGGREGGLINGLKSSI